jgi:hypothetical protein
MKEALGMEHLFLKRLHGGGLGGSSFNGDPERYVKEVNRCGHLSPRGPLSIQGEPGRWEGELIYRGL